MPANYDSKLLFDSHRKRMSTQDQGECSYLESLWPSMLSPFFCCCARELHWFWESTTLKQNWHSLECAPLLSFCQHHHSVELSQARRLTDRQMGVVDFSNITPFRCPLCAHRWGSVHSHKQARKRVFVPRLPLQSLAKWNFLEQNTTTYIYKILEKAPDHQIYNHQERKLHEWLSISSQNADLTKEVCWKVRNKTPTFTLIGSKNVTECSDFLMFYWQFHQVKHLLQYCSTNLKKIWL